ncbi:MAG: hypothetical protein ACLQOO_36380 [Terriglobia bacterium]
MIAQAAPTAPTASGGLAVDRVLLPADERTRISRRAKDLQQQREVKAADRLAAAFLSVT